LTGITDDDYNYKVWQVKLKKLITDYWYRRAMARLTTDN